MADTEKPSKGADIEDAGTVATESSEKVMSETPEVDEVPGNDGDDQPSESEPADKGIGDADEAPESEPSEIPTQDTQVTEQQGPARPLDEVARTGGFFPMFIGGVSAAVIGFLASQYSLDGWPFGTGSGDSFATEVTERLDRQATELNRLNNAVAAGPDLGGIEARQQDLDNSIGALSERLDRIDQEVGDFEKRMTELEKRPISESVSASAIAAYERELEALKDEVARQRAEAAEMEQSAEEIAQETLRRAALTRIQTALDTGSGFSSALADLETSGFKVPAALVRVAETGVSSVSDLRESFPDAARAALAAARSESAGSENGLSAFLRSQLGARSLVPREGSDPDAILSRVEAAVQEGRLTDALAEIASLPEVARAELTDWSGRAAARMAAIQAAENLGLDLNEK